MSDEIGNIGLVGGYGQLAQSEIDALLASAVAGSATRWPDNADERFEQVLLVRVSDHGVAGLLHENRQNLTQWPLAILEYLHREALAQAMWEARHKAMLGSLLEAMAAAAIQTILLKGTALAYLVYANPSCRKRGDTDMLVLASDRDRASQVLRANAFVPDEEGDSGGVDIRLQECWVHNAADGSRHVIDLHWQAANSPLLEGILRFADIVSRLQPLPHLSPHARVPDRVSLMIHACVHRAGHKVSPYFIDGRQLVEGDRLIWLFDLHLLARGFAESDWTELVRQCRHLGIGPVCHEALVATCERLGTDMPDGVLEALTKPRPKSQAGDYLMSESAVYRAWLDLGAMSGPRARLRYAFARMFPSAAFMRSKYPDLERWPVALLYLRRAADLVARW